MSGGKGFWDFGIPQSCDYDSAWDAQMAGVQRAREYADRFQDAELLKLECEHRKRANRKRALEWYYEAKRDPLWWEARKRVWRDRYHDDDEFRERVKAANRERKREYRKDPEYRARKAQYQREYRARKRARGIVA